MAHGTGYNGGRQPVMGSAPGVGRLNWNGSGEGVTPASPAGTSGGICASMLITGVGVDSLTPPEEQAASRSNIRRNGIRLKGMG